MNIDRARTLKQGDLVYYPEDRGSPAGSGKVTSVGTMTCKSLKGQEFIWVEVQHFGKKSVWPSNRLG